MPREPRMKPRRIVVILGETRDIVLERIASGGRENARLAHPSAHHFAPAARRLDEVAARAEQRSDRRTEPFRQAHRHRIETLRNETRLTLSLDGCIPQPCAVEMHGEPV